MATLTTRPRTPAERDAIEAGRAALLRTWHAPPFMSSRDAVHDTVVRLASDGRSDPDHFVSDRASAAQNVEHWVAQAARHGFTIVNLSSSGGSGGGGGPFDVYVPHDFYLRGQRWRRCGLPLWINGACCGDAAPYILLAAFLACIAVVLERLAGMHAALGALRVATARVSAAVASLRGAPFDSADTLPPPPPPPL